MNTPIQDPTGTWQDMAPAMELALSASFGSVERWREEFVAMGTTLGDGSAWVLLRFLPLNGRLVNQWAADHTRAPADAAPLLALNMNEYADHLNHGVDVHAYVDAFMANIAWDKVYERYQQAVHAASAEWAADPQQLGDVLVLDVRRAGVFEQAKAMLPGASWRDPARVSDWATDLPQDREIVVYCVYGHEVGRSTALRLRAAGLKARFLSGGIDAWTRSGGPLQPRVMVAP